MNLLIEGMQKGYVIKTEIRKKVSIDGNTDTYDVYKVKLDYLYYNDKNDRIATWISEYKAKNNVSSIEKDDISGYNDIIENFIRESNPEYMKKTQNNIEAIDQQEPGVILNDGRIIDGNRRFACLRALVKKSDRFGYFETIILDKSMDINYKEIKKLELMIQQGKESRVDYNPIDRLVGVYNDVIENKLFTVDEYAKNINQLENDVKKSVEIAGLLVEFLEFINAPKKFYIARHMDLNGPLVELHGILKKVADEDKKEDIKNVVFLNFLMKPDGDMTRFIRKFKRICSNKKYLDELLEKELDIAEHILDRLPEDGKMDTDTISRVFRSDEETKGKLKEALDLQEGKVKANDSRNKPLVLLERAGNEIEEIDTNIFIKLGEEQLDEIVEQVERINELLIKIKEKAHV